MTHEYKPTLPNWHEMRSYNKYAWMRQRQRMKRLVFKWRREHGLAPLPSCLPGASFWVTPSGGAYRKDS